MRLSGREVLLSDRIGIVRRPCRNGCTMGIPMPSCSNMRAPPIFEFAPG